MFIFDCSVCVCCFVSFIVSTFQTYIIEFIAILHSVPGYSYNVSPFAFGLRLKEILRTLSCFSLDDFICLFGIVVVVV